jgi:3-oxoacyl-[acyl-carrier-protein] synthase II
MGARDVVITGIGLVSSVGEGTAAHLAALDSGARNVDAKRFAPYPVHPAVAINWDLQIAKKADQRQMEAWQKLGVYAAGMALAEAGLKGNKELLSELDVIVAAGGGERDYGVDEQILVGLKKSNAPRAFLNERLMSDVRPTLFLAQLSNLLAGNISIVHGVTGATRTFMGEEQAGVDVLNIAAKRIAARQGDAFLVGGSYNAERPDIIMIYGMGRMLWRGDFVPVFERESGGGGFIAGSGGAFLVVEARERADKRGASPIATLRGVATNRVERAKGAVSASLRKLWSQIVPGFDAKAGLVLSGATGVAGITAEERDALVALAPGARVVASGDIFGHMVEAQFPAGVALAAAAIKAGKVNDVAVSNVGQLRGEGLALVGKAD